MAGFDDLLTQSYTPPKGQSLDTEHVIGTTLTIDVTVEDGDGETIDLSTGYTAAMTPYFNDTSLGATFTQTLTSGRQIVLTDGVTTGANILVRATPAASSALFSAYAGKRVRSTLILTRTSDGAAAPIWVECLLPLSPKLNP